MEGLLSMSKRLPIQVTFMEGLLYPCPKQDRKTLTELRTIYLWKMRFFCLLFLVDFVGVILTISRLSSNRPKPGNNEISHIKILWWYDITLQILRFQIPKQHDCQVRIKYLLYTSFETNINDASRFETPFRQRLLT